LQPEAKKVKKAYQLSPEWDKLIKKDTANKNLWDQVKEIEVFTRKEFLDKVSKLGWFLLEYIFSYHCRIPAYGTRYRTILWLLPAQSPFCSKYFSK
jgi:hypothetical protein